MEPIKPAEMSYGKNVIINYVEAFNQLLQQKPPDYPQYHLEMRGYCDDETARLIENEYKSAGWSDAKIGIINMSDNGYLVTFQLTR